MTHPTESMPPGRPDLRERLRRDADRYARRQGREASFWRSLGVLGAIGWPIVLAAVGGALVGRWLDARWRSGIRMTMILLVAGVVAGGWIAWRAMQETRQR